MSNYDVFNMLVEGRTYEEIAAILGQPANYIRSRFSKQQQKIKERLQP